MSAAQLQRELAALLRELDEIDMTLQDRKSLTERIHRMVEHYPPQR